MKRALRCRGQGESGGAPATYWLLLQELQRRTARPGRPRPRRRRRRRAARRRTRRRSSHRSARRPSRRSSRRRGRARSRASGQVEPTSRPSSPRPAAADARPTPRPTPRPLASPTPRPVGSPVPSTRPTLAPTPFHPAVAARWGRRGGVARPAGISAGGRDAALADDGGDCSPEPRWRWRHEGAEAPCTADSRAPARLAGLPCRLP